MKVYLAADHAGFAYKEVIKMYLRELSYEVEDVGAYNETPDDDYPEIMALAAQKISENPTDKAIIFGGSGQGEAMVANRFKEVRAAVYYGGPEEIITLSREHNDANVLSLGARFLSEDEAKGAVKIWLETDFSDEDRHSRRIEQIDAII